MRLLSAVAACAALFVACLAGVVPLVAAGGTDAARGLLPEDQREDPLVHMDASNLMFVVFRHAGPAVVWFVDPFSEGADRFEWELEELAERARTEPELRDILFVRVDGTLPLNKQLMEVFGIHHYGELPVLALLPPAQSEAQELLQSQVQARLDGLVAFDPLVPLHSLSHQDVADWLEDWRESLLADDGDDYEDENGDGSGGEDEEGEDGDGEANSAAQLAPKLPPPIVQYLGAEQLDLVLSDFRFGTDVLVYFQDPESGWSEAFDAAFEQVALVFQAETLNWADLEAIAAEANGGDPNEHRLLFVRHDTSKTPHSQIAESLGVQLPVPYPVIVYYSLASPTNKYVKVYHGERQAAPLIDWLREERGLADWHAQAVKQGQLVTLRSVAQLFHTTYHPASHAVVLFCDSQSLQDEEAAACSDARSQFQQLARLWSGEPRVVFLFADKQIFQSTSVFTAFEVTELPHVRVFRAAPALKTVQTVIPGTPTVRSVSRALTSSSVYGLQPTSAVLASLGSSSSSSKVKQEL